MYSQPQPGVIVEQPMMMQQPMMVQQQPMMQQPQMMPGMMMVEPMVMQPLILVPFQLFGMDRLASLNSVYIKQKFLLAEALTGCQLQNTYSVFERSEGDGGPKGKSFIKCKEQSSCWARNCLHAHCRPFNMEVSNDTD